MNDAACLSSGIVKCLASSIIVYLMEVIFQILFFYVIRLHMVVMEAAILVLKFLHQVHKVLLMVLILLPILPR
jgi:hypothetical protein